MINIFITSNSTKLQLTVHLLNIVELLYEHSTCDVRCSEFQRHQKPGPKRGREGIEYLARVVAITITNSLCAT